MADRLSYLDNFCIGLYKQSAYGTKPPTPTEINTVIAPTEPALLKHVREYNTRAHHAGLEFPYQIDLLRQSSTFNPTFNASKHSLAWIIPLAFGAAASDGGPDPVIYTYDLQAAGDLPVGAIVYLDRDGSTSSGSYHMAYDLGVQSFSISGSGDNGEYITISANFVGSGSVDIATTYASLPSLSKDSFCGMGGLTFSFGAVAGEADITSRITSFNFNYNNNNQQTHRPGTQSVGSTFQTGARTADLSFTVLADNSNTFYGYYTGETLCECNIAMDDDAGDTHTLDIDQCYVTDLTPTTVNGSQAYDVSCTIVWDANGAGYTAGDKLGLVFTQSLAAANDIANTPLTAHS